MNTKTSASYGVVYVTCANKAEADIIARTVVEKKYAACVNIVGPITSVYVWEGEMQQEAEWLLILKTEQRKAPELEKCIKSLHSYTVPEFIMLPVITGSEPYLHWITQSLSET